MGSAYSEIPAANMHIIALMEILTRFSVPIFFFISAFGLFYNLDLQEKFHYASFLRRRFRVVLIPYLFWSFSYLLLDSIFHQSPFPDGITILYILFFGTAKYHIYFLVILLWFYVGMPLWIAMLFSGIPKISSVFVKADRRFQSGYFMQHRPARQRLMAVMIRKAFSSLRCQSTRPSKNRPAVIPL